MAGIGGLGSWFAFGSMALLVGVGVVLVEPDAVRTRPAAAAPPTSAQTTAIAAAAIPEPELAAPEPAAAAAPAPTSAPAVRTAVTPVSTNYSGAPNVIYGQGLQCAIYARQRTGVSLSGAARVWWDQAEGLYERTHTPQPGAIMAMGGTSAGHVAVVARVLSAREILIDHANWMNRGEIQTGALAVDVSEANDWSRVRVWHVPSNQLGLRPYPVIGFIIPGEA